LISLNCDQAGDEMSPTDRGHGQNLIQSRGVGDEIAKGPVGAEREGQQIARGAVLSPCAKT
jgi:hypothetical protein